MGQSASAAELEQIADSTMDQLEAAWELDWRKHLADLAIDSVRHRIKPRQYQIFDLYVLRSWRAGDVARALRVSLAQVYLARHRVAALIREEARRLEQKMG